MAKAKETFNKKEKEKKRVKQRQDKRQKMEERKANKKKGKSLEGMMAYLDENGNLTDTPPDPRYKRIFKQEDIQIGVPKLEKTVEEFSKGIVTYFNKPKGFGFINDSLTNERVFFHIKDILEPLEESNTVQFLLERGPRGLNAVEVSRVA